MVEVGDQFGSTLAVANVQQLATSLKDDQVPSRYVRDELELDQVSIDESVEIPVIDMGKLVGDHDNELDKLHSACRDWGFFQVINHGVGAEVILKMKADILEFFDQPLQEKMKYAQRSNQMEGYGQAFVGSEEQKLDWSDMMLILTRPLDGRNMSIWPTIPSSFRVTLDQYSSELEKLSSSLLSSMAKNLGLEPEKLLTLFKEGVQASKVIGLSPHSDGTELTLLTQANEVQGLQIRRDGKWVPIVPIPGAFIVNVGDIIEVMSNGEYKRIEHRAVVNLEKERLSIAASHSPSFATMIGPLPDLLIKDQKKQAPNYKSMSHLDFLKLGSKIKLDGKYKGLIHHMKIQTEAEQ